MTQQWKPISSAPKDGSEFLACYARQGNVKQIVKWNTLHGYFSSKGEPLPGFTTNATHWQPLPADPGTPPASAQDDAKDELATFSLPPTCSLQPVATAFFTEKGEVAYTGIYDRTLKALNAVKTTRMGISAGSIDLYTKAPAPAAGDALDALRELVACDNIKKQIASMQVCILETDDDVQELDAMMSDLARRQPAAWDAARAALAAQVPHKGDAA